MQTFELMAGDEVVGQVEATMTYGLPGVVPLDRPGGGGGPLNNTASMHRTYRMRIPEAARGKLRVDARGVGGVRIDAMAAAVAKRRIPMRTRNEPSAGP